MHKRTHHWFHISIVCVRSLVWLKGLWKTNRNESATFAGIIEVELKDEGVLLEGILHIASRGTILRQL